MSHVAANCIRAENEQKMVFRHFGPHEMSLLGGLTLGHLRYLLRDAPRQPNASPHCPHKVCIHKNNVTLSLYVNDNSS